MKIRDDLSTDFFHRFRLFEGLEARELESMADLVEYRIYEDGERIVEEGDRSRDMFVLADGTVEVVKGAGDGARRLATLEAEAVIGELGLVLGKPRSATAVAAGEAHLLCVGGTELIERRREGALAAYKVEHNVLESLANRQADMNRQLIDALEDAEESRFQRDEVTDLREQLAENWSF